MLKKLWQFTKNYKRFLLVCPLLMIGEVLMETLIPLLMGKIVDGIGLQRGRFPMLDVVMHHEGCTQCEIAELLHISPASVTVSLRRMADEGDQRCKRIYLTEEAREIAAVCQEKFEALDAKMFAGLSAQELETLSKIQNRLFENMAGEEFRDLSPFSAHLYEQRNKKMEETDA